MREEFEAFLERNLPAMRRWAARAHRRFRIHEASVEDLLQDLCLRVWRSYLASGGGSLRSEPAWLVRVTERTAADLRRMERRRKRSAPMGGTIECPGGAADAAEAASIDETCGLVAAAVRRLSAAQRTLIERRYFDGETAADIAASQGCSRSFVHRQIRRAIDALREWVVTR